jgi:hypothetical protein
MHAFVGSERFLRTMNPVLFEIFCAADHGTVRRYVAADGGFAAELAEPVDEQVLSWGLRSLQDGILAFAAELAEALRREGGRDAEGWIALLRDGGLAAYDMFRREPGQVEAEAFGTFPHADSQTHRERGDCAPLVGMATQLRLGLGMRAGGYDGHWPEASVRRTGGKVGEALFRLRRLRRRFFR